jgi:protein TonB
VLEQVLANIKKDWSGNSLAWGVVLALHLAVIWALASGMVLSFGGGPAPEMQVSLLSGPSAAPQPDPPPPEPEMQVADATPPDVATPDIVIDMAATTSTPGLSAQTDILPPRADPSHINPSPALPAGHSPGVVTLTVLVAADGSISDARIAQSSGQSVLDQLALAFAKARWRFRAALQQGRPVADWTTVLVRFGAANAG